MLSARFKARAAAHPGVAGFLFEHGLGPSDRSEVASAVREGLGQHSLTSDWWSARSLPLLVATTEIGYDYEGTGTDFWPKFADQLGVAAGHVERQAVSRLFARASERYDLAVPAETPWNYAFCHIAWPILHAVMPRELHRPFARCLNDVRIRLDLDADDAGLVAPLRQRARFYAGSRLIAWLETPAPAAAITRHLLGRTDRGVVDGSALARITADLAKDQAASAALSAARRRQKALEADPVRRPRGRTAELEIRKAPLVLRRSDQQWSLAVKLPQMDGNLRVATRETLDAMRWRALFWGQGRPIAARSLFSDHPIPISVERLSAATAPLLGDLANLPIAPEALAFLGSLRLECGLPMLFTDADWTGDHLQLLTAGATIDRRYIILLADASTPPPASAQRLGRIAGCQMFDIDTGDESIRTWLIGIGIPVRESAAFAWFGCPEIEQHRPVRRFARGDLLAFMTTCSAGVANNVTLTEPDNMRETLEGGEQLIATFVPTKRGRHAIAYGGGETMLFDIVDPPEREPLLSVRLEASLGTIGELVARSLALRFESSGSLEEAELALRLTAHGRTIAQARALLPDTPCRIPSDHTVWEDLLGAEAIVRLLEVDRAMLEVRVEGLLSESFEFERAVAPFEWMTDSTGRVSACDEAGELELWRTAAGAPLKAIAEGAEASADDIILLRAGRGEPAMLGGICAGPSKWKGAARPVRPERLPRRMASNDPARPGARDIIDALIAWSAANVDHPVTQYRRGQVVAALSDWTVEQLCGPNWSERERALSKQRTRRFSEAFVDACAEQGIGFCVDLPGSQQAQLRRILMRRFDRLLPDLPLETGREPIGDAAAAMLDDLFNQAYAQLAADIEMVGDDCPFDPDMDVDVGECSDAWDCALRAARQATGFVDLVALLRPLAAGDQLALAEFEIMAPDEAVELLSAWIARNRPPQLARTWNPELVEAAFWIFAKPAVAGRLAWRAAAERLLADSFTARAIRYAALRSTGVEGAA